MKEIEKALKLYSMMAERCEKSGVAPRQATVYREMVDFMSNCETVSEATAKIKNSKYYLAPSAALLQDKLAAFEKAAKENGMTNVAQVYQNKIKEIDDNTGAMYETGYEKTANNLKIPYIQTLEAFSKIYNAYQILSCCSAHKTEQIESACYDLKDSLDKLSAPSSDFETLAGIKKFRNMIPTTDERFEKFVKTVSALRVNGTDFDEEKKNIQDEHTKVWKEISDRKSEIIGTGKVNIAKMRQARTMVISPETKNGKYTYTGEEVIQL